MRIGEVVEFKSGDNPILNGIILTSKLSYPPLFYIQGRIYAGTSTTSFTVVGRSGASRFNVHVNGRLYAAIIHW